MDSEQRKEYNKNYYQNKKNVILEKLKTKVECQFCARKVSACNLNKHYTLPICISTQAKNKFLSDRQNI
jgi:hypothetical protein